MVLVIGRGKILKENVTAARLAFRRGSASSAFCFASDPFGVSASLSTLLVLIAAALWGYGIILMRQIARQEPTLLQMLAINTVFLIGTGRGVPDGLASR